MVRAAAMLAALLAGSLLPGLSAWSWAIRWILLAMLFLGFSGVPLARLRPERAHLRILLAMPASAAAGWLLLAPFGRDAQLAGLLVGATPTATAAPVVTAILGGDAGFVAVSLLASSLAAALLLPPVLALAGAGRIPSPLPFVVSTAALVLAPLLAAALVRRVPKLRDLLPRMRRASFPLWVLALLLAAAKTSAFLRASRVPPSTLAAVAAGSGLLCAGHFLAGRALGGKARALEAGQSLGQKNTMLTLWMGLSAFGPVAALGPACYVLWHNLWNAFQMAARDRLRPS